MMHRVGPTAKEAALFKLGLLPKTSCKDAMRNFKAPTKATTRDQLNPNARKDWNAETQRAKLEYVRDTAFPQQDTALANGEQHRLLSCLYYHELARLDNLATKEGKVKETKVSLVERGNLTSLQTHEQ